MHLKFVEPKQTTYSSCYIYSSIKRDPRSLTMQSVQAISNAKQTFTQSRRGGGDF